jgi:hypothetical protein
LILNKESRKSVQASSTNECHAVQCAHPHSFQLIIE